ncbi:MAG: hypothetical protein WA970_00660 [Gammaproteobacteria bacterium]
MTKKILVALSLAALTGAPAFAVTFDELDVDKDGKVSAEEAEAAEIDLSTIDVNQDGYLDEAEFNAAAGATEGGGKE